MQIRVHITSGRESERDTVDQSAHARKNRKQIRINFCWISHREENHNLEGAIFITQGYVVFKATASRVPSLTEDNNKVQKTTGNARDTTPASSLPEAIPWRKAIDMGDPLPNPGTKKNAMACHIITAAAAAAATYRCRFAFHEEKQKNGAASRAPTELLGERGREGVAASATATAAWWQEKKLQQVEANTRADQPDCTRGEGRAGNYCCCYCRRRCFLLSFELNFPSFWLPHGFRDVRLQLQKRRHSSEERGTDRRGVSISGNGGGGGGGSSSSNSGGGGTVRERCYESDN